MADSKYPWEGRTMRNTVPSMRLGPLQAVDEETIMPVTCWQLDVREIEIVELALLTERRLGLVRS